MSRLKRRNFRYSASFRARPVEMSLLLVLLPMMVGCEPQAPSELSGRWIGSTNQQRTSEALASVSQPPADAANKILDDRIEVRLAFFEDGRFESSLKRGEHVHQPVRGLWQVRRANGKRWQVALIAEGDQRTVLLQLVFATNDVFTAAEIDGDDRLGTMEFHRENRPQPIAPQSS